jgi:hypothetical protein
MPRKQSLLLWGDILTINSLDTEALPSTPCHGIRSNILYPTYVTTPFFRKTSC